MRKKQLVLLCTLFAFVFCLAGVVLLWILRYQSTGLSLLAEKEGVYSYNGKLLLSDEDQALLYQSLGNMGFAELPLEHVDLSPYGFEGEVFSYFRVETKDSYGVSFVNFYPPSASYEPFWSVCMGERFVYLASDGKKYRIHPDENLCYPIFADSIEGVDPYGQDVIAFSANATYAVALSKTTVTVYQTDPMDESLRVVDAKTYSLSEFGTDAEFGAFVGNTQAYFTVSQGEKKTFVALDCATGQIAKSLLDPSKTYSEPIDRLYAQRLDVPSKEKDRLIWNHLLLGNEYQSPRIEGLEEGTVCAVSSSGEYAVANVTVQGEDQIFVLSQKRNFSLSSLLAENESVRNVSFLYENVIAVSIAANDGTTCMRFYKICF